MRISDVGSVGNYEQPAIQNNQSSRSENVAEVAVQPDIQIDTKDLSVEKSELSEDTIDKAVEQANKSLKHYDRYIQRAVHEKTKAVMYVMKDAKTNEVVREFPPKKIQDMIAKMWELAGLFVDEKA